jgi:hypothetical protein
MIRVSHRLGPSDKMPGPDSNSPMGNLRQRRADVGTSVLLAMTPVLIVGPRPSPVRNFLSSARICINRLSLRPHPRQPCSWRHSAHSFFDGPLNNGSRPFIYTYTMCVCAIPDSQVLEFDRLTRTRNSYEMNFILLAAFFSKQQLFHTRGERTSGEYIRCKRVIRPHLLKTDEFLNQP